MTQIVMKKEDVDRLLEQKRNRSFNLSNQHIMAMEDYARANGGTPSSIVNTLVTDWYETEYQTWLEFVKGGEE